MDKWGFFYFVLVLLAVCYFLAKSEKRKREAREAIDEVERSEVSSSVKAKSSYELVSEASEAFTFTLEEGRCSDDPLEVDYQSWVSILSAKNPHISEFQLYGTKAAVIWGEKGAEDVVQVVCITSFSKGVPVTKKYEYYQFDIAGWYWSYMAPRGSAGEVKSYIKSLGLSGAKEKATA